MAPLQQKAAQYKQQIGREMVDTALAIRNILTPEQIARLSQVHQQLQSLHEQIRNLMGPVADKSSDQSDRFRRKPQPMVRAPCANYGPEPAALEELILRARAGDRRALKLLIERYQARMAKFVLSETRDANAYEDLCQAVFVKMVIALPRLRDVARFELWLFQIARNVMRDHRRAALGWRRYFVAWQADHESIAAPAEDPRSGEESRLERTLESFRQKTARCCGCMWRRTGIIVISRSIRKPLWRR